MEPQNAIIGDSTGVELPQKEEDTEALEELRKKAKYSKTKEYKELRQKAEDRIKFYQTYIPQGYATADTTQRREMWATANLIIAEFQMLFAEHENAVQILKEEFNEG